MVQGGWGQYEGIDTGRRGSVAGGGGASWRLATTHGTRHDRVVRPGGINWPQGCIQDSDMLHGITGIFEFPIELLVKPSVPVHLPVDLEIGIGKGLAIWRCSSVRTTDLHRLRPNRALLLSLFGTHTPWKVPKGWTWKQCTTR